MGTSKDKAGTPGQWSIPPAAPTVECAAPDLVTCDSCAASCCRLEVLCLTDTGVPRHYLRQDAWGGDTMARLQDGWCAALDRDTLRCRIYEQRPLVCRELEMGGSDCLAERAADTGGPIMVEPPAIGNARRGKTRRHPSF